MQAPATFRWWHRGDLDGFFGLFVDNLIQLILIVTLCTLVLGMPGELVYGRILPGVAVSLLLGNLFYAWQAKRLFERTGRPATALPYGVNTVSLFAYVLFVMLPVVKQTSNPELAWQMGLVACLGSGLIELSGAWIAARVKRITPRAALLATLAGIALSFISMDFAFRIFADPLIGFAPLALILMRYVAGMRLPFDMPAGLAAVLLGTALAWGLGRMDADALAASATLSLHPPLPAVGDIFDALGSAQWLAFLSVILPMGLFNLVGSMQNLESAEAAGDTYPVTPSLAVNGAGTIAAACFGSCFPTTIYIGHPAWKRMGAGSGYSVANGAAITLLCCLGLVGMVSALIPIEAGAAILLWIGMVIAAQAFGDTDRRHAPAIVLGLVPAMAAWGLLMLDNGLRAAGTDIATVGLEALGTALPVTGMLALERGFIFTSMLLAAMAACLIDRHYSAAAGWAMVAAAASFTGIIHGYDISEHAVVNAYGPSVAWPFALGYLAMAVLFRVVGRLDRARNRQEGGFA